MREQVLMAVGSLVACMAVCGCDEPPAENPSGRTETREDLRFVKLEQTWEGEALLGLQAAVPAKRYVADPVSWARVWAAFRGREAVPAVDFNGRLVLVAFNDDENRVSVWPELDHRGNLRNRTMTTLMLIEKPKSGRYQFAVIQRAGINTIDGEPITQD